MTYILERREGYSVGFYCSSISGSPPFRLLSICDFSSFASRRTSLAPTHVVPADPIAVLCLRLQIQAAEDFVHETAVRPLASEGCHPECGSRTEAHHPNPVLHS